MQVTVSKSLYQETTHRAWCFSGEVWEAVFRNGHLLVYSSLIQNSLRDEPVAPVELTLH